jgi:hypothetical protein
MRVGTGWGEHMPNDRQAQVTALLTRWSADAEAESTK